jgi:hypothetical protein
VSALHAEYVEALARLFEGTKGRFGGEEAVLELR